MDKLGDLIVIGSRRESVWKLEDRVFNLMTLNLLEELKTQTNWSNPSIENKQSRQFSTNLLIKELPRLVIHIRLLNQHFCIFRSGSTGCFLLNLKNKKSKKLYNVELANFGDVDFAFDQTKSQIIFQTKGYNLYYMNLEELIKEPNFKNPIPITTYLMPGIQYVKNVIDEKFIIKASLDIFLLDGQKILTRINVDGVRLFNSNFFSILVALIHIFMVIQFMLPIL